MASKLGGSNGFNLKAFQNNMCEEWFRSTIGLQKNLFETPMPTARETPKPWELERDDESLRVLLVFFKHGAVNSYCKCPCCGDGVRLVQTCRGDSGNLRYQWICSSWKGKNCWETSVTEGSVLQNVSSSKWSSFLHLAVLMKESYRVAKIYQELEDRSGCTQPTVDTWKARYWAALKQFVEEVDEMKVGGRVGGRPEIVAVDESALGRDYSKVNKPSFIKNKPRTRLPQRVLKTLPGRTVWKKPSASGIMKTRTIKKRPGAKVVRNPSADKRSNSRWIWGAVEVGLQGGAKKTHKDGSKRICLQFLPRKADAPRGRPRGKQSLLNVMSKRLKEGSGVVADEWTSTPGAVEAAGSSMEGTVNHSTNWRNPATGVHSNDIESEFARFKLFLRVKYDYARNSNASSSEGKDLAMEHKLAEYVFYTNVGQTMDAIMAAFKYFLIR